MSTTINWWSSGHEAVLKTLEDFDAFAIQGFTAVLYSRAWSSSTLPTNLRAGATATALGLKSLDAVSRSLTVEEGNDSAEGVLDLYQAAYFEAKGYLQKTLDALGEYPESEEGFGAYSAAVALQRLVVSFQAAHLLYRLGLNLEGDAVSRQILEQIAWALDAASLVSLAEIEKVSATKAVSRLEILVPGTGRLYGALSKAAHAGLDQHRQHVRLGLDSRGEILLARQRLSDSAAVLLRLADMWVAVCEATQFEIVNEFRALRSRDDLTLNPERAFLQHSRDLVALIVKSEEVQPRNR